MMETPTRNGNGMETKRTIEQTNKQKLCSLTDFVFEFDFPLTIQRQLSLLSSFEAES